MEYKEIICLLVPIIFNGIILFVFQKHVDRKFQQNEELDKMYTRIFKGYFKKIRKVYHYIYVKMEAEFFWEQDYEGVESYDREGLKEHLKKLTARCKELNAYYKTYEKILDKDKKSGSKYKELMKELEHLLSIEETENPESRDIAELYNKISDCVDGISEIAAEEMDQYEKKVKLGI